MSQIYISTFSVEYYQKHQTAIQPANMVIW
jgi:hypothetical protein